MEETTENQRIGGRMRRAAEASGVDAEAVATALGVKSETVYRMYQGKITVTAARLQRFASLSVQNAGNQKGPHRERLATYEIRTSSGHRIYVARQTVHDAAIDALSRLFSRPEAVQRLVTDYAAARAQEAAQPRRQEREVVRVEYTLPGLD